jgi:hypothetical protein
MVEVAFPLLDQPPGFHAASLLELPVYWALLTDSDRRAYLALRQAFSSSACKHRRNHSTEINRDILASLRAYVMRGDSDDWKRAMVCGICWLPDGITINTRQLRLLVGKRKSSINMMFQNIGFGTSLTPRDSGGALVEILPILKNNVAELRKWTLRFSKLSGDIETAPIIPIPPEQ